MPGRGERDQKKHSHDDHHGKTRRRHNSPNDHDESQSDRNYYDNRSRSRKHHKKSRRNDRDKDRKDEHRKRYRSTSRSRSRSPSWSSQSSDSSLRGWGSDNDRDIDTNKRPAHKKPRVRVEEAGRDTRHSGQTVIPSIHIPPSFFDPNPGRTGPRIFLGIITIFHCCNPLGQQLYQSYISYIQTFWWLTLTQDSYIESNHFISWFIYRFTLCRKLRSILWLE